jgi:hypothetical protein
MVSSVKRFSSRTARQSSRSHILAKRSAQLLVLRHSEPPKLTFQTMPPTASSLVDQTRPSRQLFKFKKKERVVVEISWLTNL